MAKKIKSFTLSTDFKESMKRDIRISEDYSSQLSIDTLQINVVELHPNNPRDLIVTVQECLACSLEPLSIVLDKDDPEYTRKYKEIEGLITLAKSIKKNGLINPISVYREDGRFWLKAGERRTLASALAHLDIIPARISYDTPSSLSLAQIQWTENIDRQDFNLSERIICINSAVEAFLKENRITRDEFTVEMLAEILNLKQNTAYQYFALWNSKDKTLLDAIYNGKINSIKKAYLIATEKNLHKKKELLESVIQGNSLLELAVKKQTIKPKKQISKPGAKAGKKKTIIQFGKSSDKRVAAIVLTSLKKTLMLNDQIVNFTMVDWDDVHNLNNLFSDIINEINKNPELYFEKIANEF